MESRALSLRASLMVVKADGPVMKQGNSGTARYSVRMLRAYFEKGRSRLDREMAEILADHLDAVVGEVFGIAREIDEEYSASEA